MPLEIVRLPQAEDDLYDIWTFAAQDSPRAADRLLDKFMATLRTIAAQPSIGRLRPELQEGLRSMPKLTYVIFYRIRPEAIELVRVLSAYRDITSDDFG